MTARVTVERDRTQRSPPEPKRDRQRSRIDDQETPDRREDPAGQSERVPSPDPTPDPVGEPPEVSRPGEHV
jgi:hypothetical protein